MIDRKSFTVWELTFVILDARLSFLSFLSLFVVIYIFSCIAQDVVGFKMEIVACGLRGSGSDCGVGSYCASAYSGCLD